MYVFTLILSTMACEVETVYDRNLGGSDQPYLNIYRSNNRNQYVLFAPHTDGFHEPSERTSRGASKIF